MADKRKFRRVQVNVPALLLTEEPTPRALPVIVSDVSYGGVGLVAAESLPGDSLVTLQWAHPPFLPGTTVIYRGRIKNARQKKSLFGQFVLNMAFEASDPQSIQKVLDWAQMQVFLQAKARLRGKPSMSY